MASAPEKRRKNTAAKQLPSWLHPAVSTIRSYPKTVHQTKGVYPPCSAPLFSFQAIVIIIGVRTFHWVLLYYTCKRSKNQSEIWFNCCCQRNRKKIAAFVKLAILFWRAWEDTAFLLLEKQGRNAGQAAKPPVRTSGRFESSIMSEHNKSHPWRVALLCGVPGRIRTSGLQSRSR